MKNKKQILKLLILSVLFLFTALQYTEVSAAAEMISRFCNEEKPTNSVLIEFDGTEEKEVCINVGNYGDMDGTAFLYFTDGEVNKANSIVCRDEGDEKKNLAKYIYLEDENDENNKLEKIAINLPAGKKAQIKGKIKFPAGFSGMSYGCLITSAGVPDAVPGTVTVALRRSSTIIAKVGGEINVGFNFGYDSENFHGSADSLGDDNVLFSNDKIAIVKTKEGTYFRTTLENNGNTKLKSNVMLTVSNIFKYNYKFENENILLPETTKEIEIPIEKLPFYDGKYDFEVTISKSPIFEFESSLITDELKKETKDELNGSFFIFPVKISIIALIIIVIIICLILFIIKRRRKLELIKSKYVAMSGDTLNTIANNFGCSWKQISKLNSINPPYNIEEGMNLIVYDYNKLK